MKWKNATRACLFGGALLAGGVFAASAPAQSIAHRHDGGFEGSYAYMFVGVPGGGQFMQEAATPLGFAGLSLSIGGAFSGGVASDPSGCSFSHSQASGLENTETSVTVHLEFWALSDATARVQWDAVVEKSLRGGQPPMRTRLIDLTVGATVLDLGDLSGNHVVALEEGHRYEFRFDSSTNDLASSSGIDSWGEFRVIEGCNGADIDGNGVLNVDDVQAFVDGFLGGCPERPAFPV